MPRASSVTTMSATLMWLVVTVFSGSGVTVFPREIAVAASLTSVTVIVKAFSVKSPPASVERMRTEAEFLAS